MDKATLLTASKVELGVSTSPRSGISSNNNNNNIVRLLLSPALQTALRFQSLVSFVSLFICVRACFLASLGLAGFLHATKILAWNVYFASRYSAFHSLNMSSKAAAGLWSSRQVQRLRKKLWYEFAVFILGSGNAILLMLFWPGWWLLAATGWAIWALLG